MGMKREYELREYELREYEQDTPGAIKSVRQADRIASPDHTYVLGVRFDGDAYVARTLHGELVTRSGRSIYDAIGRLCVALGWVDPEEK